MYAIIEAGGKQYDVKVGDAIQVEKIDAEVGSKITFDAIFVSNEDGTIKDWYFSQGHIDELIDNNL